jgi:hypothetical protein
MSDDGGRIVRQIDHILLKTDDVRRLFALLSGALRLPVAWPLFPYRGFLSGAVSFGSVNLEILEPVDPSLPAEWRTPGTRLLGLAFEPPTIEAALSSLDERGINHGLPEPFRLDVPGGAAVSWTTVDLDGRPECPIRLLVKYDRDQDARRAAFRAQLRERAGGPLGIEALAEVELGVGDLDGAAEEWQPLLSPPAPDASGAWRPEGGPSIRFVSAGSSTSTGALVAEVRSLEHAGRYLDREQLLGATGPEWVALDTGGAEPAVLRFREARG